MQYKAYATTKLRNGVQTPIQAECIVIEIGQDKLGRPMEITIDLQPSIYGKDRLTLTAYPRLTQGEPECPLLLTKSLGVVNQLDLFVEYDNH